MLRSAAVRAARASLAARGPGAASWRAASAAAGAELRARGRQAVGDATPPTLSDASLLRRDAFVAGAWLPLRDGPAVVVENPGAPLPPLTARPPARALDPCARCQLCDTAQPRVLLYVRGTAVSFTIHPR